MKNMNYLKIAAAGTAAFLISTATGFTVMAGAFGTETTTPEVSGYTAEATPEVSGYTAEATPEVSGYTLDSAGTVTVSEDVAEDAAATASLNMVSGGALDTTDMFTSRDLEQTADLSEAQNYTIADGQTIKITSEGVHVITGTAANASIVVEAGDEDKVQIVLDGVSITNDSTPCIYVKSADKVFVTTTSTENALTVTGTFTADGDTNTDAVIFSKDDLQRLMNRRTEKLDLYSIAIDEKITDRYYQKEAIRAVCDYLNAGFRRNLLVMATGTGKTVVVNSGLRAHQ